MIKSPKNTVRVAILAKKTARYALLQKIEDSKNPNAWEFPGGKIDDFPYGGVSEEDIFETAIKEILEETRIDLSKIKLELVETFTYFHEAGTKKIRTRVFLVLAEIDGEQELIVDPIGEDKHARGEWKSLEEIKSHLFTSGSEICRTQPLAKNSRHLKKLS